MAMIQQGLRKMHRRKIKPARFFYFLDSVIKNMTEMRDNFHACRVIITGKLRGGTVRTSTKSAGFGVMPRQSLSADIRLTFGEVRSKYGAFGIKLLTWRKSQHTREVDALVFKKALDSNVKMTTHVCAYPKIIVKLFCQKP
jgi:ribosomal protein S3